MDADEQKNRCENAKNELAEVFDLGWELWKPKVFWSWSIAAKAGKYTLALRPEGEGWSGTVALLDPSQALGSAYTLHGTNRGWSEPSPSARSCLLDYVLPLALQLLSDPDSLAWCAFRLLQGTPEDDFDISFERTNREFCRGEFADRYQQECSVQDSSLAEEEAIWLGVDRRIPPELGGDGELVKARMHLTAPMARALIVVLTRFVGTGSVMPEEN